MGKWSFDPFTILTFSPSRFPQIFWILSALFVLHLTHPAKEKLFDLD